MSAFVQALGLPNSGLEFTESVRYRSYEFPITLHNQSNIIPCIIIRKYGGQKKKKKKKAPRKEHAYAGTRMRQRQGLNPRSSRCSSPESPLPIDSTWAAWRVVSDVMIVQA